jgi:hypothetical protein
MSDTISVGSLTFFINTSAFSSWIGIEDAKFLVKALEKQFDEKLKESGIGKYIYISSTEWKYGCVMETITLSVVTGALVGGVIKYPDIKKGIRMIAKDIHNSYLYLNNRLKTKHKVLFIEDELRLEIDIEEEKKNE